MPASARRHSSHWIEVSGCDRLRAVGEYADTILVFTSDNGYLLGEHRWRNVKVLPYEASLRVPLLMAGPSIPVGVARDAPVSTVDLTATVLDWANAWLAGVDGRSVIPDLTSNRGWRRAACDRGSVPTPAAQAGAVGRFRRPALRVAASAPPNTRPCAT